MSESTSHSPFAVTYARSLLELATEQNGAAEAVGQEMRELKDVVESEPIFFAFLADPGVSEQEREDVLKRVLGGRVSPLVMNFVGVLNAKGRLRDLTKIADAYNDLLDEMLGKVEVDVTVAQKLPPEQLEQVRVEVGRALGKDAVVHQYVDEAIIGGLVIRVGDKLIDASVRNQLSAMRQQLLAAAPK